MELKHYAELGEEYLSICLEDEELAHGRNGLVGELPSLVDKAVKDVSNLTRNKYIRDYRYKGREYAEYGYGNAYPKYLTVDGHSTQLTFRNSTKRGIGIYSCPNGCTAQIKFTQMPGSTTSFTYKIIEVHLKKKCPQNWQYNVDDYIRRY